MVIVRYIAFVLSLFTAYFALAQKPQVEVIVEHTEVEVGNQFTVIVKSNITGELNIKLPKEFEIGPNVFSNSSVDIDGNTGEVIHTVLHGKSGSFNKAGTYTLGPAFIRRGNKVYRSNKVKIKVISEENLVGDNVKESLLHKPATGAIDVGKRKVYCGEPIVLQPIIYSKFKPEGIVDYERCTFSTAVDQHFLVQADQVGWTAENINGRKCYIIDFNKQVVFVNSPGKIIVKPFKMTLKSGYDGYSVRSKRAHFKVIPLPEGAPKSFTGGVGTFNIDQEVDKSVAKQGDIVTLTIKVSGVGNLHDVNKPKIKIGEDFKLYGDVSEEKKYSFTSKGAEGAVLFTYHLQAINKGNAKLPKLEMSFFDPKEEQYKTITSEPLQIKIETNPSFVLKNDTVIQSNEMAIARFNDEKPDSGGFFSSSAAKWVGFSAPVCAAFLFLLFRKRKEEENNVSDILLEKVAKPQINSSEYLSVLLAHANNGNSLPFFTQLSKDLQVVTSIAAKDDENWVLSAEEKNQFFEEKGYSEDFKLLYFELQQTCELCRYGCQQPEDDLHIYVTKAKSIFETLEG